MAEIVVNQVKIYYELTGPVDAPVLVLNNGILMNAVTSWAYQVHDLSRHYRVLRYDCRGQGQSDHPEGPYSMELHAADLAALLDCLEIESAHIAGISYGGEVAQAFALSYPEKTRSLILADTVSEVGPELHMIIQSWLDAARSENGAAFFNATVPWNFSPEFIAANPALLADARRRYQALDFAAVARLCEGFLGVNFTDRLGEIAAPACILVGEKDILKGLAYAQILKAGIPHAELHLLRGAGHASCWEKPQEFNTIILGFLARTA
jgi:3-oxoadipate enol-lactonase